MTAEATGTVLLTQTATTTLCHCKDLLRFLIPNRQEKFLTPTVKAHQILNGAFIIEFGAVGASRKAVQTSRRCVKSED